jgi:hypothetical protein
MRRLPKVIQRLAKSGLISPVQADVGSRLFNLRVDPSVPARSPWI